MTLYIIRHGETAFNRQNIVQGSGVDSELNAHGRRQADLFFKYYQDINFDIILTSALKRTHQTLEPFILRGGHKEWKIMPELNEISWGIHEGKVADEASKHNFERVMSNWLSGNYHDRIENGESAHELAERCAVVVEHLKAMAKEHKNVLVCTHGRTLLCLLTLLNDLPISEMKRFKHQNTGLYKFHFVNNEFLPEWENDARHL